MNYILYHNNCDDGFASALVAWTVFNENATYVPCNHGDPFPVNNLSNKDNVYIFDFSFKRDVLLDVKSKVNRLIVLDHHVTAQKELEGLDFCTFDMNKSGAMLTYEYFYKTYHHLRRLIEYVQDRDLWKFELYKSKEFNAALRLLKKDFNEWLKEWNNGYGKEGLIQLGETCLKLQSSQVDFILNKHLFCCVNHIDGKLSIKLVDTEVHFENDEYDISKDCCFYFPIVNTSILTSECCHELLNLYPNIPISGAFFINEDGKAIFSLRSRKEFDSSVIAKAFGGGGHKQACGFEVKNFKFKL